MYKKSRYKKRKNQQLLLDQSFKVRKDFGGSLLKKSNAKIARPISTKKAMHVVLRSSLAKGKYSLLSPVRAKKIRHTIHAQAKLFQVKIYEFANVGNHLHLLVRATHKDLFKGFLRAICGLIARITLGAERGRARSGEPELITSKSEFSSALKSTNENTGTVKFWDQRPFTRIVEWRRDFAGVKKYVVQNFNEAMGFVAFKPQKKLSTA